MTRFRQFNIPMPSCTMSLISRSNFRTYILVLCGLYLMMILLFHSDLQEPQVNPKHAVQKHGIPLKDVPAAAPSPQVVQVDGQDVQRERLPIQGKAYGEAKVVQVVAPADSDAIRKARVKILPNEYTEDCEGPSRGFEDEFLEVIPDKLFVFSAYWDTRPNDFDNKGNGTYIRLMTIYNTAGRKAELQCIFNAQTSTPLHETAYYYEMCENHGRRYGGFILSCKVPPEVIAQPCSVQVAEKGLNSEMKSLKVKALRPRQDRNQFAVCVPPLFGTISPSKLVEFIELSSILGVEKITFYDYQVTDSVAKVLEYYQENNMVSVVPWLYPSKLDENTWYHGQSIAIQDCLYRNMATTKFLAFNDIDEFIVPHVHANWEEMISATFQPNQCAFQFHSAFFDDKDTDSKSPLFTMAATRRTSSFSQVRTKCMVKPYLIFEKGIHHVSKPIWADLTVNRMAQHVAFLHHYRECMRDFGMSCNPKVADNILHQFQSQLGVQVASVSSHLDL